MKEIWKDIKGFENYQVSNLGRIKRKGKIMFIKDDKQKRKYYKRYDELIMKQFKDNVGYYSVTLIRTFNSMSEAKRYLGINRCCGTISEVCNGKRNKAKGYIWRYHE